MSSPSEIATQNYLQAGIPDSCLAEVVRISKVDDISGADKIQQYTVNGWKCVAKKNEFKEEDLVVYIRINSVLDPRIPTFAFLEGKPLKTKKIRGALSQGLIGPLSWLGALSTPKEGDDITHILGIKKYIEPEEIVSHSSGRSSRPSFIPKTDADRVQNISQETWNKMIGHTVHVSRKEDGTSTTYFYHSDEKINNSKGFGITSRNCLVGSGCAGVSHYFEMAQKFQLNEKMCKLGANIAIQGEIVGPGINGNRLKLTELDFRVFGIWHISEDRYMGHQEVSDICKQLGLNQVPHLGSFELTQKEANSAFWLEWAEKLEYSKGIKAEGLVVRINDGKSETRLKAVANSYLLKHNL